MARTSRLSKTLLLLSVLCGACFSQQFQVSKIANRVAASNVDIGPDGHLYAVNANIPANAERQSRLLRYRLDASGVPTGVIDTIYTWTNLSDCTVGLAFDPDSTPDLVHAYVSISQDAFVYEWGGRIERIVIPATGDATRQILYYGLPVGFHQINDIGFGPDGKLIIHAGSTTTSGMPGHFSNEWNEKLLSAAFLKAVVKGKNDATNVQTAGGYSYNPHADGAPMTTWVVSIRNPFDGTWHSNGNYYAGTNQNDVNGDTGDCNGQTQNLANQRPEEFLAMIRPQNTYGFPNPSRSECVLMGGNPTAAADPWEVPDYRVGITPPATFDASLLFNTANVGGNSPDGILEYQAEGNLKNKLIQAFYSYWGYIMTYTLGADGKVASTQRLQDETGKDIAIPWILDLAEHPVTGHLYAAAYGDQADNGGAGGIWFLRRTTAVPAADMLKTDMLTFKIDAVEGVNPPSESVRIWNAGTTGTTLKYTLTSDAPWITLTPANGESSSGTIPQRKPHAMEFNLGNLAQGVHTGRVTVSATGQTPVVITVIMTVANNTKLSNKEPQVDAGSNQNLIIAADKLPLTVTLSGSATDDGWPNPPGYVTYSWLLYQGDASAVTILNSHNATTTAVINHFGIFIFQLHASDGDKISSSLVTYFIDQIGNAAPKITVFTADQYTVHLGTVVKLNCVATDDGLPNPPSTLSYQWGRVETGVGIATFTNDTNMETFVSFSEVSSYLLQCTVSDATKYSSEHFVIIVVDANVTITDSSAASTGSSEITQTSAPTANTVPSDTAPSASVGDTVPATQQGGSSEISCESTPEGSQSATRPAEPGNGATTAPIRQSSDAVKIGISALMVLGLLFV